jgi:SAM-dependent methyltransferase
MTHDRAMDPLPAIPLQREWPAYYDAVAGKPPRDTLLKALALFEAEGFIGRAVDLGCGDGRDSVEMLSRGWAVTAIDGHPEALARFRKRDIPHRDRLTLVLAAFESVAIPPADLVNASFSLPFCSRDRFGAVWERIVRAIRPGGRFAGQLFGERDSWAVIPGRTHHARAEVDALLRPLEVEMLVEDEKDGNDATGVPKHWHVFHIVARRA